MLEAKTRFCVCIAFDPQLLGYTHPTFLTNGRPLKCIKPTRILGCGLLQCIPGKLSRYYYKVKKIKVIPCYFRFEKFDLVMVIQSQRYSSEHGLSGVKAAVKGLSILVTTYRAQTYNLENVRHCILVS